MNTLGTIMFHFAHFSIFCSFIIFSSGYEFRNRGDLKTSRHLPLGFMYFKDEKNSNGEENFNVFPKLPEFPDYGLTLFEDNANQFRDHSKKSDSRPKYDPGWKFIGLGKRPGFDEDLKFTPDLRGSKDGVNSLLGISNLINFEFFNAIRDGMENVAKETVKKESSINSPRGFSGDGPGNLRFDSKMNLFGGRQKSMYDPGWMLTGLGK